MSSIPNSYSGSYLLNGGGNIVVGNEGRVVCSPGDVVGGKVVGGVVETIEIVV